MRVLVFLLILFNLLFFSYTQGYLGAEDHPDALRSQLQVKPELLRVVSRGESPAETETKVVEVVPAPAEPPPPEETVAEVQTGSPGCIVFSDLLPDSASRLSTEAREAGLKVTSQNETRGWWVFIPPQLDKKAADKKAAELQRLGVTDFFVVTSEKGPKFSISLGVFSTEDGAQKRLEQLKGQGVRSAQVGQRRAEGGKQTLRIEGQAESVEMLRKNTSEKLDIKACP
ncbi:MAG: SPOR domain-containing protein [Azovibrio sp.]